MDEASDSSFEIQDGLAAAKIVRVILPITFSPVMVVDVQTKAGSPKSMILKLYDRRFEVQHRVYKHPKWTPSIEEAYIEFVKGGSAASFLRQLDDPVEGDIIRGRHWSDVEFETFLYIKCIEQYDAETYVYKLLLHLQGKGIPEFYGGVRLFDPPSSAGNSPFPEDIAKYFEIHGILTEFIDGFSLRDLADNAPRESWQVICEEAIRIVLAVSEPGILNEDCCVRNLLVRKNETNGNYEVFQIDFALSYERDSEQSDESWLLEKSERYEEGAIGTVIEHELKGAFVYTPTGTYHVDRPLSAKEEQQLEEYYRKRAEEKDPANKEREHTDNKQPTVKEIDAEKEDPEPEEQIGKQEAENKEEKKEIDLTDLEKLKIQEKTGGKEACVEEEQAEKTEKIEKTKDQEAV